MYMMEEENKITYYNISTLHRFVFLFEHHHNAPFILLLTHASTKIFDANPPHRAHTHAYYTQEESLFWKNDDDVPT